MNSTSTLATTFVQSIATIFVIIVGRRIDMFEKESWKKIVTCTAFGAPTFALSTIAIQTLFHVYSVQAENYTLGRTICLLLLAGIIQIFFMLLALSLYYTLDRKEFDTLSDYILYSISISAGYLISSFVFQYSLTEISILPFRQAALDTFYVGPAFMDSSVPFLSAGIGLFLFLVLNQKSINSPSTKKIAITVLCITIFFQALFLVAGLLLTISNEHMPSKALLLGDVIAECITITSVLFIVISISVGAVVDFYLISKFVKNVSQHLEFVNPDRRDEIVKYLSSPASYSSLIRIILEQPKPIYSDARLSTSLKNRIAKLALISWKQSSLTNTCINEASQAIKELESGRD